MPAPGMTTEYSFKGKPSSFEWAMFLNGFHSILRTGGRIPARSRCKWRNGILIKPDDPQK